MPAIRIVLFPAVIGNADRPEQNSVSQFSFLLIKVILQGDSLD